MAVIAFPRAVDALVIRPHRRGDGVKTLQVFREAVRRGAAMAYSQAELRAWAPDVVDLADWIVRRSSHPSWVAERRGEVIGFTGLTAEGEVDMLYVHPDHTRRGVGYALLDEVEQCARAADMKRLSAHVSLVAAALFVRAGFVLVRREWVERGDEHLARVLMEKMVEPTS